jgi:hypothetical protein
VGDRQGTGIHEALDTGDLDRLNLEKMRTLRGSQTAGTDAIVGVENRFRPGGGQIGRI